MRLTPPRLVLLAVLTLLLGLAARDLARPPAQQLAARAAVSAIRAYRSHLTPYLHEVGYYCRMQPTCSHYGEEAIGRYGLLRGSWMTVKRLARCGPWTPKGTVDPVP
jgi:uncharacterized protein